MRIQLWKFGRDKEEREIARREERMLRTCLRIRTERERDWKKKSWKGNQWETIGNNTYFGGILKLSIIKKFEVSLI